MSTLPTSPYAPRPRRPPRRSRIRLALKVVLWLVLVAAVFAVGIALGESLHENPRTGDTKTQTRQLKPVPLPPVTRTVTVRKS